MFLMVENDIRSGKYHAIQRYTKENNKYNIREFGTGIESQYLSKVKCP